MKKSIIKTIGLFALAGCIGTACRQSPPSNLSPPATLNVTHRETIVVLPPQGAVEEASQVLIRPTGKEAAPCR